MYLEVRLFFWFSIYTSIRLISIGNERQNNRNVESFFFKVCNPLRFKSTFFAWFEVKTVFKLSCTHTYGRRMMIMFSSTLILDLKIFQASFNYSNYEVRISHKSYWKSSWFRFPSARKHDSFVIRSLLALQYELRTKRNLQAIRILTKKTQCTV
jgi:hypothetical protein